MIHFVDCVQQDPVKLGLKPEGGIYSFCDFQNRKALFDWLAVIIGIKMNRK